MGKHTLILILGAITIFASVNLSLKDGYMESGKMAYDFYSETFARNVATSAVNLLLSRIAADNNYRTEGDSTMTLMGGTAVYSVTDGEGDDAELVKIQVSGTYENVTKNITVLASVGGGWVPAFIRGAWTANASLDNTISDMRIDGRNHDSNGNLIPNTGVFGVSSSVGFVNTQSAEIGGTTPERVDYPMVFPEDSLIIEENYDWGGTFPETPDAILGYPEGTLEAIAKSGQNGSQYVMDPPIVKIGKADAIGGLTYPISGVTYIYITNGTEYEFVFQQNGNQGILVVHGPDRTSRLKGVKYDAGTSDGVFRGLLITDYSFHHHVDILGGVLQLSPNLEIEKSCNGNEDHWVYFSGPVIEEATGFTSTVTGFKGNNSDADGFGTGRVKIYKWYE